MRGEVKGATLYRGDRLADRLHLRLFTAEQRFITPEWRAGNVLSSYWRFYRNDNAGASLLLHGDTETEDIVYPLAAERLYFVPAGVRFSCRCTAARIGHLYAHFDVLGLPAPALRELFARPVCLPPSPTLEAEVHTLSSFLTAPRAAAPDDMALHCRLKSVLYGALALHLETVPDADRARCLSLAARMEPVRPTLDYIEAHLGEKLSASRLAALCCLSEDHFARRFRECVGVPPGEWVTERRVQAAAQCLLLTEDSLETIAETYGFGNRYYLTRVFAHRMGAAPATYRRAGRV